MQSIASPLVAIGCARGCRQRHTMFGVSLALTFVAIAKDGGLGRASSPSSGSSDQMSTTEIDHLRRTQRRGSLCQ